MSAEQEIETQRRDAVKAAMVMKRAFTAERTGLRKKLKAVKDREKAMYDALQRNGVSRAAFEEAEKRATQDQKDLDIFDSEAAEVETWIRDWIENNGEKETPDEPESDEAETIDEDGGPAPRSDENPDNNDDRDDRSEGPEVAPQPEEESSEPEPIPAAAESEPAFEGDPNTQTEEQEPEWDMGATPAADPKAAEKTRHVAPAAGAAGVSMDDIPMPQSQIHDLQQEQAKRERKFVDRRERMSAADYNDTVKAGSGQS